MCSWLQRELKLSERSGRVMGWRPFPIEFERFFTFLLVIRFHEFLRTPAQMMVKEEICIFFKGTLSTLTKRISWTRTAVTKIRRNFSLEGNFIWGQCPMTWVIASGYDRNGFCFLNKCSQFYYFSYGICIFFSFFQFLLWTISSNFGEKLPTGLRTNNVSGDPVGPRKNWKGKWRKN